MQLSLDPSKAHAVTASTGYAFTLAGSTITGPSLTLAAPDAGTPDAGTPDAGVNDAGTPDAGPKTPAPKKSGCGAAGADGVALFAGVLGLLARRRRR